MKRSPKSISDIAANLDDDSGAHVAATDAIAGAVEQIGVVLLSLISIGARVAASCAQLERRVGVLEKQPVLIDETGNDEAHPKPSMIAGRK